MENNLTKRQLNILSIIIENYSKTGEPVSSDFISKHYLENDKSLSSATIRNEMSFLEEKGFLEKLHVASGRIPSKIGYCLYVDNLKNNYCKLKSKAFLEEKLSKFIVNSKDTKTMLENHLEFLTEETGLASVLLLPDFFSLKMSRVEFVRLGNKKLMVVLISTSGLYRQVIVESEKDFVYEELVRVSNYINKNYFGLNLYEIKKILLKKMQSNINEMDNVTKNLLYSSYNYFQAISNDENNNLIVKGISKLFSEKISNISTLHKLVESFEQKKQIINLISNCLDSDVSVIIEDGLAENLSFIVSPYRLESGMTGAFGLLGPMSMDYKYLMSTMKCLTDNIIEKIIMI